MPGKFSIILMKDDGSSRRIRMKLSTARLLLALLVIVPVLTGASVWLNYYLLRSGESLHEEIADMRQRLTRQEQTTARLANLEQFLGKNDPDNLSRLVASPGADSTLVAERRTPFTDHPVAGHDEAATDGASSEAPQAGDQTTDAGAQAVPDAGSEEGQVSAIEDSTIPSGQENGEQPGGESSSGDSGIVPGEAYPNVPAEDLVDKGYIRQEDLSARQVGARSLRISFKLFNNGRVSPLSGKVTFDLVLPDGRAYPLGTQGDTKYRIHNMKPIVGNPTLPPEVTDSSGAQIRINIYADDELVYRRLTPIQR